MRLVRAAFQMFLDHAPRPVVQRIAEHLATGHRLHLEPGWRFDPGADDHRLTTELRRDLWLHYRDHSIEVPVIYRWYDGIRLRLALGNDLSLCLYVGGSFEPNEFALLAQVLRPGMVVVDGGANEGLYTLFAARRVGASGLVLAIEPSAREISHLLANLELNGIENGAVIEAALGSSAGEATLAIAQAGHEGQNTVGNEISNPKVAATGHQRVSLETLDGLVERHALSRLDVIKLDIEGSEVEALLGGVQAIKRFRPLMLLEAEEERLASQGRTKGELIGLLGEFDYALWVFDSATAQLRNVEASEPEGNVVAAPRGWVPPRL